MDNLLKLVIEAHGGLERWCQFDVVRANASITGALWRLKASRMCSRTFTWLLNFIANIW
jgi:hypothetical protein